MKQTLKTWLFLLTMSLIVSASLTAISAGLRERIERNLRMVQVRSVLEVLDVQGHAGLGDAELLNLFDRKVVASDQPPGLYFYYEDDRLNAVAFEAVGRGLWDQIKALIAVEPDGKTIRGVRFYEQNETPGLGAEIGSPMFEKQFVGKSLYDNSQILAIVSPSAATLSHTQVHGITGATLTCDSVNLILKQSILNFQKQWEDSQR